jgi:hypothetical protein
LNPQSWVPEATASLLHLAMSTVQTA